MRLRPDLAAIALGALLLAAPALPAEIAESTAQTPGKVEIDRAVEKVKADPNMAAEKTVRTLTWDGESKPEDKPRKSTRMPKWLSWIGDFGNN